MKKNDIFILLIILFILFLLTGSTDQDSPNWKHLKTLRPDVRKYFIAFIKDIEARGYRVIVTDSSRTYSQQAAHYKTDPRNAAPGGSTHEKNTALDLNIITPNGTHLKKSTPKYIWLATGIPQLAKTKYGMRWGGDFKTYHDPIHYDYLLR